MRGNCASALGIPSKTNAIKVKSDFLICPVPFDLRALDYSVNVGLRGIRAGKGRDVPAIDCVTPGIQVQSLGRYRRKINSRYEGGIGRPAVQRYLQSGNQGRNASIRHHKLKHDL